MSCFNKVFKCHFEERSDEKSFVFIGVIRFLLYRQGGIVEMTRHGPTIDIKRYLD